MQNNYQQDIEFSKVERHLNIQSVLFWIMGGLGIIFSIILIIAGVAFNIDFFDEPGKAFGSADNLDQMNDGNVLYLFFFLYVTMGAIIQIINGNQMRKRKNREISLFAAVYTLFAFPFGSILGIYSLITMSMPATKEYYFAEEEKRIELLLTEGN